MQEVASTCKVRAMPTFQIYQQGNKVEEIVGADAQRLETLCTQYNASSSPFSGQGHKLGSVLMPPPTWIFTYADAHHTIPCSQAVHELLEQASRICDRCKCHYDALRAQLPISGSKAC